LISTLKIEFKIIGDTLKKVLLNLSVISSFAVSAQSISKQVISSVGKTQTNSNIKLSYTLGEPLIGLMSSVSNQIGNGYYPSLNLQALNIEDDISDSELLIYPNPTSHLLFITHLEYKSFYISIFDLNGKEIYNGFVSKGEAIDFSTYSEGIYILTVNDTKKNKINTYQIIKK
jgi:hypothetical protein